MVPGEPVVAKCLFRAKFQVKIAEATADPGCSRIRGPYRRAGGECSLERARPPAISDDHQTAKVHADALFTHRMIRLSKAAARWLSIRLLPAP